MKTRPKIFIGADHRGVQLKNKIREILKDNGYTVEDEGTFQENKPCDYPIISYKVAQHVAKSRNSRGILVCMTGIGHTIAANKVPGINAALCYNKEAAVLSRQHNNANILVLGARFVSENDLLDIVKTWLTTEFEEGRHLRRVKQIRKIEQEVCKSSQKSKARSQKKKLLTSDL